ncbi:DUF7562 family protein [Haloarcula pellucida]|uniref:Small CPxCG-related zinc finger protein n=1 Tax=Haloarcula pellucida TaxID=1427151 RepID=A0A830GNB7_9EURY|nr:hypothetical protein [Halomicroarcula pellucida]MBX0347987.1 hypothetical protein [Halomicroarcula pellucida]GGN96352.1 hypothetical protein GCM10009030_24600 [Halomicroarcula pellucida]
MSDRNAWHRDGGEVTCLSCGESVSRDDAREYDKHGDRWNREEKSFEFLCKPCYRECCHSPRRGLEERLIEAGAGTTDQTTFLRRYCALARDGTPPERER